MLSPTSTGLQTPSPRASARRPSFRGERGGCRRKVGLEWSPQAGTAEPKRDSNHEGLPSPDHASANLKLLMRRRSLFGDARTLLARERSSSKEPAPASVPPLATPSAGSLLAPPSAAPLWAVQEEDSECHFLACGPAGAPLGRYSVPPENAKQPSRIQQVMWSVRRSLRCQKLKLALISSLAEEVGKKRQLHEQANTENEAHSAAAEQDSTQDHMAAEGVCLPDLGNLDKLEDDLTEALDALYDSNAGPAYEIVKGIHAQVRNCVGMLHNMRDDALSRVKMVAEVEESFRSRKVKLGSIASSLRQDIERMQAALLRHAEEAAEADAQMQGAKAPRQEPQQGPAPRQRPTVLEPAPGHCLHVLGLLGKVKSQLSAQTIEEQISGISEAQAAISEQRGGHAGARARKSRTAGNTGAEGGTRNSEDDGLSDISDSEELGKLERRRESDQRLSLKSKFIAFPGLGCGPHRNSGSEAAWDSSPLQAGHCRVVDMSPQRRSLELHLGDSAGRGLIPPRKSSGEGRGGVSRLLSDPERRRSRGESSLSGGDFSPHDDDEHAPLGAFGMPQVSHQRKSSNHEEYADRAMGGALSARSAPGRCCSTESPRSASARSTPHHRAKCSRVQDFLLPENGTEGAQLRVGPRHSNGFNGSMSGLDPEELKLLESIVREADLPLPRPRLHAGGSRQGVSWPASGRESASGSRQSNSRGQTPLRPSSVASCHNVLLPRPANARLERMPMKDIRWHPKAPGPQNEPFWLDKKPTPSTARLPGAAVISLVSSNQGLSRRAPAPGNPDLHFQGRLTPAVR